MTGFRVSRVGLVRPRRRRGRPLHVRQGHVGRAARGGVRRVGRRSMAHLAPAGPVYQAGHAVREPRRGRRGARHAAGTPTTPSTRRWTPTPPGSATMIGDALSAEGVPHRVQCAGNLLSVFFTEDEVHDYAGAQAAADLAVPRVLPRAARPRASTRRRARSRRGSSRPRWTTTLGGDRDALPYAAKAAATALSPTTRPQSSGRRTAGMTRTVVHLLRHGEVHNPDKILYGRLPGFRLSETGRHQADIVAKAFADADLVAVLASPMQRAQETAAPAAAAHGLPVLTDDGLIEAGNSFEGRRVGGRRRRAARRPQYWPLLRDPFTPVVGRAVPATSRTACSAPCTARASWPRGTRRCACRTSCRSGRCAGSSRASGCGTTRGGGSARWPR